MLSSNGSPEARRPVFRLKLRTTLPRFLLAVLHGDRGILDLKARDGRHFHRLFIGRCRRSCLFLLAKVGPVVTTLLIGDEANPRTGQANIADFDLALEQGQQAHAYPRFLNGNERLFTKAGRIPQARRTGLERQPRKNRQMRGRRSGVNCRPVLLSTMRSISAR